MAGKIVADTLEHSTAGSIATNYVVNGSAKAWVNFNGTGTIAARDSLNTSGLVDNGTGDYSVNLSNSMSNANYVVTFGLDGISSAEMNGLESSTARRNTASVIGVVTNNSAGSVVDIQFLYLASLGDLA